MLRFLLGGCALMAAVFGPSIVSTRSVNDAVLTPPAALDSIAPSTKTRDTAVFAGGCFWGVEAVFEHVNGVTDVVSGYAGGDEKTASYDLVSLGTTKHAESVRVIYDPSVVSYGTLLRVFFSIAHDPTQLNRQGPDVGPQYRSAIFYMNKEQERVAKAYIKQIEEAKVFKRPIVTTVDSLDMFYPAEAYHQNFARRNPRHPYIVAHDLPKVRRLEKQLPELYRESAAP
jgi:peptide-methionine (S)-S-oxide reductase